MTLDQLPRGKEAVIRRVGGCGELRLRLLDMGMLPGTRVAVVHAAPTGDPLELSLRDYVLTLRKAEAALIEVEEDA